MKKTIIVLLNLCMFLTYIQAQEEETTPTSNSSPAIERRFNGGLTLGFNATQIDGDRFDGYNKLGLYGGIEANVVLTEKKYIGTGIIFSQRGSSPSLTGGEWKINFNMIEVPLIFHYCDWKTEKGFYKVHSGMGLLYGRLLNSSANGTPFVDYQQYFKTNNLSWLLEATFFVNKHFGIGLRYSKSFNKIYNRPFVPAPNTYLLEKWISIKGVYLF